MKTKLGISVGLVGAAVYFSGLFGGYTVLTLFVGYILLAESNPWLRKTAVKAFAICVIFSLLNVLIGFIPTGLDMIGSLLGLFDVHPNMSVVYNLFNLVYSILDVIRTVLLLILGVLAFNQSTIPLGPLDNLIHKHM